MDDPSMARAHGIAALFEQVARNIYPERGPKTLHPRQWAALRFFDLAGVRARTVTGLARYLGITLAPASRSVASLVRHNLLAPEDRQPDRKAVVYALTDTGRETLTQDPLGEFAQRIADLSETDRSQLMRALEALLQASKDKDAPLASESDQPADGDTLL